LSSGSTPISGERKEAASRFCRNIGLGIPYVETDIGLKLLKKGIGTSVRTTKVVMETKVPESTNGNRIIAHDLSRSRNKGGELK